MGEKEWLIIKVLFEEKQISKAAKKLFISQPTLSYQIQQIENKLGYPIILRGKKGVEFTLRGEMFFQYALKMISFKRQYENQVDKVLNRITGTLKLGVSRNFSRYKLPQLLFGFLKEYSDVKVQVNTGWTEDILDLLNNNKINVGILRGDNTWDGEKQLLSNEPICIVSNNKINISELYLTPRISYETDLLLKNVVDKWWERNFEKKPNIIIEVDDLETCKELVKKGLGYAIFPSICLEEDDDFHKIKIKDEHGEEIMRKTWLIYKKEYLDIEANQVFIRFLIDNLHD